MSDVSFDRQQVAQRVLMRIKGTLLKMGFKNLPGNGVQPIESVVNPIECSEPTSVTFQFNGLERDGSQWSAHFSVWVSHSDGRWRATDGSIHYAKGDDPFATGYETEYPQYHASRQVRCAA